MLDATKYAYFELELPNIKGAVTIDRKDEYADYKFGTDYRLKEFITQAAMKFPMWSFIGRANSRSFDNKTISYRAFEVFENREFLGDIQFEYGRGDVIFYAIGNKRIEDKRQRGSRAKTKDIKKALKILQTSFGAKSMEERVIEAKGHGLHSMEQIHRSRKYDFESAYGYFTRFLAPHVFSDWDKYSNIAKDNGSSASNLEKLPESYESYDIAERIYQSCRKGSGAFVTIHGNDYAVRTKVDGEDTTTIKSGDELPEWLRRGVGMLKLVEKEQYLRDVGFKIDDQSFYVVDQGEQHE